MKKPGRQPKRVAPTRENAGLLRLQFCFFVSGAAGLMYQVIWTSNWVNSSVFRRCVATVLAVFMGGLAAGSAIFARWRPLQRSGVALYARMEFAIAFSAWCSLPEIPLVRQIYLSSYPHLSGSALGLPAILMGGTLPVLLSVVAHSGGELGPALRHC